VGPNQNLGWVELPPKLNHAQVELTIYRILC
jgi:hypothetical protein